MNGVLFMIKTKRLLLKPLNADELLLELNEPNKLDEKMNLNIRHIDVSKQDNHVRKALEYRRKMVMEHPNTYEWYTEWAVIEAEKSVIIGGIMLMSERKSGEVEIGYGIEENYKNNGYMTEAVSELIDWMFKHSEDLIYVVAETEKDNIASQKVIIHAGMTKYKETEDCYWWRIGRNC